MISTSFRWFPYIPTDTSWCHADQAVGLPSSVANHPFGTRAVVQRMANSLGHCWRCRHFNILQHCPGWSCLLVQQFQKPCPVVKHMVNHTPMTDDRGILFVVQQEVGRKTCLRACLSSNSDIHRYSVSNQAAGQAKQWPTGLNSKLRSWTFRTIAVTSDPNWWPHWRVFSRPAEAKTWVDTENLCSPLLITAVYFSDLLGGLGLGPTCGWCTWVPTPWPFQFPDLLFLQLHPWMFADS